MTKPDEVAALDIRTLTNNARRTISRALAQWEYPLEEDALTCVKDHFDSLQERAVIKDYSPTKSAVVEHTWESLYPNHLTRALVQAAAEKFGVEHTEPHWFHKVLPYAVTVTDEGQYVATLRVPYKELQVTAAVTPVRPVEWIKVAIKLPVE